MSYVNWTNVTQVQDLLQTPNTTTGGYFFLAVVVLIFLVLLIIMTINFGVEIAVLSSAFISLVISIFFVYMDLLAWGWSLFFMAFIVMDFLYIMWSSNRDNV